MENKSKQKKKCLDVYRNITILLFTLRNRLNPFFNCVPKGDLIYIINVPCPVQKDETLYSLIKDSPATPMLEANCCPRQPPHLIS